MAQPISQGILRPPPQRRPDLSNRLLQGMPKDFDMPDALRKKIQQLMTERNMGQQGLGALTDPIQELPQRQGGLDVAPQLPSRGGVDIAKPLPQRGGVDIAPKLPGLEGVSVMPQGGRVLKSVPFEEAKKINIETQLPQDDAFKQAVQNTNGAEITPEGLKIDLLRFQQPAQTGDTSIRTGSFFLPKGSKDARFFKTGEHGYGGRDVIEGTTLYKRPYFVKGAVGGKAPERAFDAIKGKGAFDKMRSDVLGSMDYSFQPGRRNANAQKVADVLQKHGGSPDLAEDIIDKSPTGNQLPTAMQENIIANAVRSAGYDSVIGFGVKRTTKQSFISEVFDVRSSINPTANFQDYDLHEEFDKPQTLNKNNFGGAGGK